MSPGKSSGDRWVFGFGSLMWLPGFAYEDQSSARVHGWHRRFSVISTKAWGSEDRPGLVVALHPGGSCLGVAFRIAAANWPATLAYLQNREQAYRFIQVKARLPAMTVNAVTFASDPKHPRTAANLSLEETARLIQQGRGSGGSSRFYFASIEQHLRRMGQSKNHLMQRISRSF